MKDEPKALIDFLRENRTVVEIGGSKTQSSLTAFVGLFNAEAFFNQIEMNLLSQSQEGVHWLIVDNNSSDDSWGFAQTLAAQLQGRVTLVKNHMNVGGTGSFVSSLDLAEGSWIATLHQDDAYYPNHLDEIRRVISASPKDTVLVTTNMDSLKYEGSRGKPAPRANLILQNKTPVDVFLAHLRFHALPFPAAAFQMQALKKVPLAWHDNSFPDTELVSKLAALGGFETSPVVTMAYRENPLSESHILQSTERQKGQMLGLLRVFGSEEFKVIAHSVPLKSRDDFFEHAVCSVTIRLGETTDASLVRRFLAEVLSIEWNYSSRRASSYLIEESDAPKGSFTSDFLQRTIDKSESQATGFKGALEFRLVPPRQEKWYHTLVVTPFFRVAVLVLGLTKIRKDIDFRWRRK